MKDLAPREFGRLQHQYLAGLFHSHYSCRAVDEAILVLDLLISVAAVESDPECTQCVPAQRRTYTVLRFTCFAVKMWSIRLLNISPALSPTIILGKQPM